MLSDSTVIDWGFFLEKSYKVFQFCDDENSLCYWMLNNLSLNLILTSFCKAKSVKILIFHTEIYIENIFIVYQE